MITWGMMPCSSADRHGKQQKSVDLSVNVQLCRRYMLPCLVWKHQGRHIYVYFYQVSSASNLPFPGHPPPPLQFPCLCLCQRLDLLCPPLGYSLCGIHISSALKLETMNSSEMMVQRCLKRHVKWLWPGCDSLFHGGVHCKLLASHVPLKDWKSLGAT
jgi:hypothetical protein